MLARIETRATLDPPVAAAGFIALAGAATLAGAWFFQYVLNLAPCPLCLEQRLPYYIGIPIAAVLAIAADRRTRRPILLGGFLILFALFMWSAWLGIFHAGVEWKWWAGPQDCVVPGTGLGGSAGGLLQQMRATRVTPCDQAAWRFLGLSLAGYNALISLALAGVAGFGAWILWRQGSSSVSQYR